MLIFSMTLQISRTGALIYTAKKMKFSIKDFFSKYDQIRSFLVKFTEQILNGKLRFLGSDMRNIQVCFVTRCSDFLRHIDSIDSYYEETQPLRKLRRLATKYH